MKTARSQKNPPSPTLASLEPLGERYVELSKLQFDTALKLLGVMVTSCERIRDVQLTAARDAQAQQQRAQEALRGSSDGRQLLAVQSGLVTKYLNSCMKYWTGLAQAAQQTQTELARIGRQASREAAGSAMSGGEAS